MPCRSCQYGPASLISDISSIEGRTIKIVYRNINGVMNHYDSFGCYSDDAGHITGLPNTVIIPILPNSSGTSSAQKPINIPSANKLPQDTSKTGNVVSVPLDDHFLSSQQSSVTLMSYPSASHLRVSSWNVRGCNRRQKRDYIEHGIVCLQETKMTAGGCDTIHYRWISETDVSKVRVYRGLAFLVHISYVHLVRRIYAISHNILVCDFIFQDQMITLVNVHIPQVDGDNKDFQDLKDFVGAHTGENLIIAGDFNAHIGHTDLATEDT